MEGLRNGSVVGINRSMELECAGDTAPSQSEHVQNTHVHSALMSATDQHARDADASGACIRMYAHQKSILVNFLVHLSGAFLCARTKHVYVRPARDVHGSYLSLVCAYTYAGSPALTDRREPYTNVLAGTTVSECTTSA